MPGSPPKRVSLSRTPRPASLALLGALSPWSRSLTSVLAPPLAPFLPRRFVHPRITSTSFSISLFVRPRLASSRTRVPSAQRARGARSLPRDLLTPSSCRPPPRTQHDQPLRDSGVFRSRSISSSGTRRGAPSCRSRRDLRRADRARGP